MSDAERIAALEARIATLEARIAAIERGSPVGFMTRDNSLPWDNTRAVNPHTIRGTVHFDPSLDFGNRGGGC